MEFVMCTVKNDRIRFHSLLYLVVSSTFVCYSNSNNNKKQSRFVAREKKEGRKKGQNQMWLLSISTSTDDVHAIIHSPI